MENAAKYGLLGAGAAALVAAGAAATVYCASRMLLGVALNREAPAVLEREREKLTGGDQWQALSARLDTAARRLRSCGCVRVELTARDGTTLVGHWYENPDARRVVVAMHGWRSSWCQDFGLIAPFFHDNGCSVLYAEQRGQQESGGEMMTFGHLERYDCLDWALWVQEHGMPGLPVYLAGISMGATTVLLAAGEQLPACVRGVVADCGFTRPHDIWRHVAENNLHLRYGLHRFFVHRLCQKRLQDDLEAVSTVEAMKKCTVPVLFIHGTDDRFVPVEMTYENYLACAAPRQLLIVPGAGHGMSWYTDPVRYKQTLLQFWQSFG